MAKKIFLMVICLAIIQPPAWFAGAASALTAADTAGREDTHGDKAHQVNAIFASTKEIVPCPEIRPQVCSQDYKPVCAVMRDGTVKTYANGCNACSDPAVTGYREGACE